MNGFAKMERKEDRKNDGEGGGGGRGGGIQMLILFTERKYMVGRCDASFFFNVNYNA